MWIGEECRQFWAWNLGVIFLLGGGGWSPRETRPKDSQRTFVGNSPNFGIQKCKGTFRIIIQVNFGWEFYMFRPFSFRQFQILSQSNKSTPKILQRNSNQPLGVSRPNFRNFEKGAFARGGIVQICRKFRAKFAQACCVFRFVRQRKNTRNCPKFVAN